MTRDRSNDPPKRGADSLRELKRDPAFRARMRQLPYAAPAAASALVDEFKKASDDGLRWTIANALEVVAGDAEFDELVRLVRDKRYEKSRQMLTFALAKMRNPRAPSVLMESLDDEQTVGHAVMALGRLKAVEARARLEELTRHPKRWIRDEARNALASMSATD